MLSTKEFVGRLFMNTNTCLRFCFLLGALIVVSQLFSGLSPAGSTTSKENSQETLKERDAKQIVELFIFARFHARPGQGRGVESALRKLIPHTRQEPGCLSIHVFRSIRDARLFYIHSRWVNEAAFDNHVSQPYTKQFVEEVQPLVDHELDTTRANLID
jgi:quinol monooxygenase YgiN